MIYKIVLVVIGVGILWCLRGLLFTKDWKFKGQCKGASRHMYFK